MYQVAYVADASLIVDALPGPLLHQTVAVQWVTYRSTCFAFQVGSRPVQKILHPLGIEAVATLVLKAGAIIPPVSIEQEKFGQDQRFVLLAMVTHPLAHGPHLLIEYGMTVMFGITVNVIQGAVRPMCAWASLGQGRSVPRATLAIPLGTPSIPAFGRIYKCMFQASTATGPPNCSSYAWHIKSRYCNRPGVNWTSPELATWAVGSTPLMN